MSNVFFFQAEDGIRDRTVTGVQTCALPICEVFPRQLRRPTARDRVTFDNALDLADARFFRAEEKLVQRRGVNRSEERRVGKSVDLGGRRSSKRKKRKKGAR